MAANFTTQQLSVPWLNQPPPPRNLFEYLSQYETPLTHLPPESEEKLCIFWNQKKPCFDSGLVDSELAAAWAVHQKLKSAFVDVQWCSQRVLLQYWSPEKNDKLSTKTQPFAVNLNRVSWNFRKICYNHEYDNAANLCTHDAFQTKLAGIFMDLRVHKGKPLVSSALNHGFISYFAVPIFHTQRDRAVGVVDCYAKNIDDLNVIFIALTAALEKEGLGLLDVQRDPRFEAIDGLKPTVGEIKVALTKICESHDLTFAQASIAYGDQTHVASSSTAHTKPRLALSLLVPCVDEDIEDDDDDDDDEDYTLSFNDHCDSWDMVPLTTGQGLAEKTLENYKPHFSPNIFKITEVDKVPADNDIKRLSCLAMCLKSSTTDALEYVLEFFWPRNRNSLTMIESLIATLKLRLPTFKVASGVELGHELGVVEVGDSFESQSGFTVFKGGKFSGVLRLKRKCKNFKIDHRQRPAKRAKRKDNTQKGQSDTGRAIVVASTPINLDNTVAIKVEYRGKVYKHHVSPTFEAIKNDIATTLNLTPGKFHLEYCDQWKDMISVFTDSDVRDFLNSLPRPIPKIYVNIINTVAFD